MHTIFRKLVNYRGDCRDTLLASVRPTLKQERSRWRGGHTVLDDKDVTVLQATSDGDPVVQLYFDNNGLLVRLLRFTVTPVAFEIVRFAVKPPRKVLSGK